MFGDDFDAAALDTSLWTSTLTGSATAAVANGELNLATGVVINSTARVQTLIRAVFLSGSRVNITLMVRVGDTGAANNIRRWGAFDANNGYFFALNGTVLQVVSRRLGVDTAVAASVWGGLPNYAINLNYHRYEITWGGNAAWFWIDGRLAATLSGQIPTTQTVAHSQPPTLENFNSGGGISNVSLFTHGVSAERRGDDIAHPRFKRINVNGTYVLKSSPGAIQKIFFSNGAGTTTVYDNTVAAGIVIIAPTAAAPAGTTAALDADCSTGITVVTTGGADITVFFQ